MYVQVTLKLQLESIYQEMALANKRAAMQIARQSNPLVNNIIDETPILSTRERAQAILGMQDVEVKNENLILQTFAKTGNPIDTRLEIAKAAKVSQFTVSKVKAIEKAAPPEMKEKLRQGEMSINEACKVNSFFLSLSIYKLLFNS